MGRHTRELSTPADRLVRSTAPTGQESAGQGAVPVIMTSSDDAQHTVEPQPSDGSPRPGSDGKNGQLDYDAIFEEIKGRPCRVDRIEKLYEQAEVPGGGKRRVRTRSHVIDRELDR